MRRSQILVLAILLVGAWSTLGASDDPGRPSVAEHSILRAPEARVVEQLPAEAMLPTGRGSPAYAIDIIGSDLVYIPDLGAPGGWTVVGNLPGSAYFGGDFVSDDFTTLYVIDYNLNELHALDASTATVTVIGGCMPQAGQSWTGAAGTAGGILYASSTDISTSMLYTVDTTTGAATLVGTITNAPGIIGIAINTLGAMYGVDIVNDQLVSIDPATGAGTVVGPLGINANYAQGLDFDDATGELLWCSYSGMGTGELRIIDLATGASTSLGPLPGGTEVDSMGVAASGFTPTPTRTPEPTPTWTPEPSATSTPEPTATSTPVPHPFGVRIEMPTMVHPGEELHVTGLLDNPDAPRTDVPTFFILEVLGEYWFWPGWAYYSPPDSMDIDYREEDVPTGGRSLVVVPGFTWPDTGSDALSGLYFYGAFLNAELTEIIGEWAIVEWGFGP